MVLIFILLLILFIIIIVFWILCKLLPKSVKILSVLECILHWVTLKLFLKFELFKWILYYIVMVFINTVIFISFVIGSVFIFSDYHTVGIDWGLDWALLFVFLFLYLLYLFFFFCFVVFFGLYIFFYFFLIIWTVFALVFFR